MEEVSADVSLTNLGVVDMGYAEDHSFATFRLATEPTSPLVEAGPFELAAAVARLQELLRFVQQGLLERGLGSPTAGLRLAQYQVDPSLHARRIGFQLQPEGGEVLKYTCDPTMARQFAHELLSAADQAEHRLPGIKN